MRGTHWVGSLCVAAVLAVAAPARAQVAADWEIAGTATLGFTDNADGSPEPEIEGEEGPEPDGFLTITPSFSLQLETPDATQTLTYAVGYTLYFIHTEISTFNQTLAYGVRAPVREGVDLSFALNGAQTTMSEFAILSAAPGGQVQATEGNDNVIFTAGASQGLSAEIGENWSFYQALAGAYAQTVIEEADDTYTTTASLSMGLSTAWEFDQLGFTLSNDMQWSPAQRVGDIDADDSLQFLHRANADWTHQWSRDWASQLIAGVLVAYDIYAEIGTSGEIETPQPQPSAGANVRFTPPRGNLTLSYTHDAAPNLLLRQITLNDTGTISGLVDLPRGWDIGGSTGVQVAQSFLSADVFSPGLTYLLDFAVGWIPPKAVMRVEGRYQFTRQWPLKEGTDEVLFPNLERHVVMLTTTFAYPRPPEVGGQRRGFILPPPTANVDFVTQQAPYSERAVDEQIRENPKEVPDNRPPPPEDD
ncbi:MAG: hypothetical protein HOW73_36810 [Polyangiaceae bacterium]|nr:hypothetical protein [Polyangiaceae bacterium]